MTEPKKLPVVEKDDDFDQAYSLGHGRIVWGYKHAQHTLADICRPGYFEPVRGRPIRVGDQIEAMLGAEPGTALFVRLVVDSVPRPGAITVALVHRAKATPIRHVGGEEPAEAA